MSIDHQAKPLFPQAINYILIIQFPKEGCKVCYNVAFPQLIGK